MAKSVKEILVAYSLEEISIWDVMAWANELDGSEINNESALNELKYIDDTAVDSSLIKQSLLNLIPNADEETLSKLLLLENLNRLKTEKITSVEFVNFVINSVWDHENNEQAPICEWVYSLFNAYNGYGFDELCEMSSNDLVLVVSEYIDEQDT